MGVPDRRVPERRSTLVRTRLGDVGLARHILCLSTATKENITPIGRNLNGHQAISQTRRIGFALGDSSACVGDGLCRVVVDRLASGGI